MDRLDPEHVRPFLYQDGTTLSLHFDIAAVQSRMRLDAPDALALDYTRAMMGWMLFAEPPSSMLLIGLGGGSLVKYCRRTMPQCHLTVVEINPHVIALRDDFLIPSDDDRLAVVCGDGAEHVASIHEAHDVILVDGFTWEGQAESLCTPSFYADCRAALTPKGTLVANLHDDGRTCQPFTDRIAAAFDGHALHVAAADGGNRIVMATRDPNLLARTPQGLQQRFHALPPVHQRTLRESLPRFERAVASRDA